MKNNYNNIQYLQLLKACRASLMPCQPLSQDIWNTQIQDLELINSKSKCPYINLFRCAFMASMFKFKNAQYSDVYAIVSNCPTELHYQDMQSQFISLILGNGLDREKVKEAIGVYRRLNVLFGVNILDGQAIESII